MNILISSQVKLFNDELILKQHQRMFLVLGDIKTAFEAFVYRLCV